MLPKKRCLVGSPTSAPKTSSIEFSLSARDETKRIDCRCVRARHQHGERGAYNRDRCRCPECQHANTAAAQAFRRRNAEQAYSGDPTWVPAIGTRRRLQALAASGWSAALLADRVGVTTRAIGSLRSIGQERVLASTAATVAALYEDCWWRTPPARGRDLARTETWAARNGWVDPSRWAGRDLDDVDALPDELDDIDQVAIARAGAGRHVRLNQAERRAVSTELTRRGASARHVAQVIGCSRRTVNRHRSSANTSRQTAP